MYEEWNYLSFYKNKDSFGVLLKIPYKRTVHFFKFSFSFSI